MARADVNRPVMIGPADGERFDFAGVGGRVKIAAADSGERFVAAQFSDIPAHALGAPLHRHQNEDEYTYVLEGSMGMQLGEDFVTADAGT